MIPYPIGYQEVLAHNHRVASKISILRDGVVIEDDLHVLSGSVNMSRSSAVRRYCTLTMQLEDSLTDIRDALLPYGNEIQVWASVYIPEAVSSTVVSSTGTDVYDAVYTPTYGTVKQTEEVVANADVIAQFSLGIFRIANPVIDDDGAPVLALTGYDRSRAIQRNRFITPYTVPKGTNYVTAITTLVQTRLPGNQSFTVPVSDETTPLLVFDAQSDPLAAVQSMATAIGMEAFFDENGVFVLQEEPDPIYDPITWEYSEGELGTLVGARRDINDEPGYNGVVVIGESTSNQTPIRSVIWDTDPTSPTFYLGAYGQVPKFYQSQFITTQSQADAAARAQFKRSVGLTQAVSITAIPNPAQELGDTAQVTRMRAGIAGPHLVQEIEMPLGPFDPMRLDMLTRRAVEVS